MSFPHACPVCRALHRGRGRCVFDGAALEPVARDPWRGVVLDGRHRIDEAITDGWRGRVYRGHCTRSERPVAIQLLFAERAVDPAEATRLVREQELAGRVRHPHVLEVIETGAVGPLPYRVSELAEGPTLADALAREPFAPARSLRLFRQLCAAVDALHRAGVVHRDLRAERVLLTAGERGERAIVCGLSRGSRRCPRGVSHTRPIPVMAADAAPSEPSTLGTSRAERADLVALGLILEALLEAPSTPPEARDLEATRMLAIGRRLATQDAGQRYASAGAILDDLPPPDGPVG